MEPDSYSAALMLTSVPDPGLPPALLISAFCLLILLLFVLQLFSGAESAFFSVNQEDKKSLEGMQGKSSIKVLQLLSDPEKLQATILVTNTFITLLLIFLCSFLLNQISLFSLSSNSGIVLQVLAIAFIILIFGKILPKVFAYKRALKFSHFTASPLLFAQKLFSPVSFLLIRFTSLINHRLLRNRGSLSIDELSEALDHSGGEVTEDRKILMGIVNFSNIEVSEIMKPRMDVVAIECDHDFPKLIKIINDSGYSRIPVFSETFDNIKGILYVKDLLPFLDEGEAFDWQKLIRPGYFVPETKKIKDLLQEFLDKQIHLAIVVDEYGGTEGIVTLEDVLEEIVGEITDESDEVESNYSRIDDYNYIFDGKILLNDFYKIVQLSEELFEPIRGEADTLAGLILEIKGEIPPANETILLKNFSFTILSVDDRRIKKVKFTMDKNLKIK